MIKYRNYIVASSSVSTCNALLTCCCHTRVCLSVVTRSNKLDTAVNHRLISWRAPFRCFQMCDFLFGCFLYYADDIIILASSLSGLHSMLDACTTVCKEIKMKFNNSKFSCRPIVFNVFCKYPKSSIDPYAS